MEIKNTHILTVSLLNIIMVFIGLMAWQYFYISSPAGGIVGQTVTIQLSGNPGIKSHAQAHTAISKKAPAQPLQPQVKLKPTVKATSKVNSKPKPELKPQKKVNSKQFKQPKLKPEKEKIAEKEPKKISNKKNDKEIRKKDIKKSNNSSTRNNASDQRSSLQAHKGSKQEGLGGKSLLPPSYLQQLLIHLQRYKYYPPFALRRHITGEAKVKITLSCQGRVEHYQLVQKTGSSLLDDTVGQIMQQANPFPPPKVCHQAFSVVVPIEFKIAQV